MEPRKSKRPDSKYSVIIKVACDDLCYDKKCTDCRFRKFRFVKDLKKLVSWLDINEPRWRWINVYNRRSRLKLGYVTTKSRPRDKDDYQISTM